jgi:hypothetical protein
VAYFLITLYLCVIIFDISGFLINFHYVKYFLITLYLCVIIFDISGFLITFHYVTFLIPSRCFETKSWIDSGVQVPEVSFPFINNSTRNKWVCRDEVPRSNGVIFFYIHSFSEKYNVSSGFVHGIFIIDLSLV